VTNIIWEKIAQQHREKLVWSIWFVTWVLLLVGLVDRIFYIYIVYLSIGHGILFLILFGYQFRPFPVQVRMAYIIWVVVGTYVPGMVILMYISTVGLATNLFLHYCPLARMLYLLPWNCEHPFSWNLVKRVFLSPAVKGKFALS
jgi:hypothetical protein